MRKEPTKATARPPRSAWHHLAHRSRHGRGHDRRPHHRCRHDDRGPRSPRDRTWPSRGTLFGHLGRHRLPARHHPARYPGREARGHVRPGAHVRDGLPRLHPGLPRLRPRVERIGDHRLSDGPGHRRSVRHRQQRRGDRRPVPSPASRPCLRLQRCGLEPGGGPRDRGGGPHRHVRLVALDLLDQRADRLSRAHPGDQGVARTGQAGPPPLRPLGHGHARPWAVRRPLGDDQARHCQLRRLGRGLPHRRGGAHLRVRARRAASGRADAPPLALQGPDARSVVACRLVPGACQLRRAVPCHHVPPGAAGALSDTRLVAARARLRRRLGCRPLRGALGRPVRARSAGDRRARYSGRRLVRLRAAIAEQRSVAGRCRERRERDRGERVLSCQHLGSDEGITAGGVRDLLGHATNLRQHRDGLLVLGRDPRGVPLDPKAPRLRHLRRNDEPSRPPGDRLHDRVARGFLCLDGLHGPSRLVVGDTSPRRGEGLRPREADKASPIVVQRPPGNDGWPAGRIVDLRPSSNVDQAPVTK